jgi:endonuclease/exonuclease/phosphatase family metal-dependent hydrolase
MEALHAYFRQESLAMRSWSILLVTLLLFAIAFPACTTDAPDETRQDGDSSDGDDTSDGDDASDGDTQPDGDGQPDGDEPLDGDETDGDREIEIDVSDGDDDGDIEQDAPAAEDFLAMTFNLRTGTAADGPNSWTQRREMVANLIAREQPAVMGVQEAWKFQIEYIQDNVPDYEWVGISRADLEAYDEYCAVLFRNDLFALVQSETFWLSDTPDSPGTQFSPNQNYPRIVTWAEIQSLKSGRNLFVFNTHFDTSSADEIPERSAALLVSRIAAIAGDAPTLVMGDFNEFVGSNAYRILTGDMDYQGVSGNLVDPWVLLELPEEGSYHGFSGVSTHTSRIDWILATSTLTPVSGAVLHDEEDGRFPSDHFPLTALYQWPVGE